MDHPVPGVSTGCPMKVVDLNCNQCGAALEVSRKANFVTCGFCSARLRIQHTDSSAFTDVIDEVSSSLESIKRDTKITRLDQEWMMKRERYQVRRKNGSTTMPSEGGAILIMVVGLFVGMVAMSVFGSMGLIIIGVALIGGLYNLSKAKSFKREQSNSRIEFVFALCDLSRQPWA